MNIIKFTKSIIKASIEPRKMSEKTVNKYVKMSPSVEDDVYQARATIANYLKGTNIKATISKPIDMYESKPPKDAILGGYFVDLETKKSHWSHHYFSNEVQPFGGEGSVVRDIFKAISEGVKSLKNPRVLTHENFESFSIKHDNYNKLISGKKEFEQLPKLAQVAKRAVMKQFKKMGYARSQELSAVDKYADFLNSMSESIKSAGEKLKNKKK